jgi:hypothetical protein
VWFTEQSKRVARGEERGTPRHHKTPRLVHGRARKGGARRRGEGREGAEGEKG